MDLFSTISLSEALDAMTSLSRRTNEVSKQSGKKKNLKATRPDTWQLVKTARDARRESLVELPDRLPADSVETARRHLTVPRLALFHSSPEVVRSFCSLRAMGAGGLAAFELAEFAGAGGGGAGKQGRRGWKKGKRFPVVVGEQVSEAGQIPDLLGWPRGGVPDTPI